MWLLAGLSQVDDCHEKPCANGLGYFPCLEDTGRNLLQLACLLNFTCESRESRPSKPEREYNLHMGKTGLDIIFSVAVITTVVTVDLLFFKHHTTQRLIANIAIVIAYASIYFTFSKRN